MTTTDDVISVRVRPWTPADRDAVVALVANIQASEFGVTVTPEQRADLERIEDTYRHGAGNFWVAVDQAAPESVIGVIGLHDLGNGNGALRRMFVDEQYRGRALGIASSLLDTLAAWAAERGIRTLYLGTHDDLRAARRFYARVGFTDIEHSALPASFPFHHATRFAAGDPRRIRRVLDAARTSPMPD
ncbi:MAG TPA: GNAT family N-acetyltransferase [Candidatus Elarobacter sp.]|nr:GNAT family N-acetyltransferase [Candidatus Elarobacter sp.]